MRLGVSCIPIQFVLFAILAMVGTVSCVTDQAHRYYAEKRYPPKNIEDVEVLWEAPTRAHVVIADFQARNARPKYMRKLAAEIGADAVIVGTLGGLRSKGDEWAGEDKYAKYYSRITGTAIRYKEQ